MSGTSAKLFEESLKWLRRHGWKFATLDDCMAMLATEQRPRNYAVITFDDAYRDVASTALPILERFAAPFTIYVPTGALTRTLPSWWLGLRQLLRVNERVTIDCMARTFRCSDYASKLKAFSRIAAWVHQDYRRAAMVTGDLCGRGIPLPELNEAYFLSEGELRALAQHPLVSIGGHSVSHPALATFGSRRRKPGDR